MTMKRVYEFNETLNKIDSFELICKGVPHDQSVKIKQIRMKIVRKGNYSRLSTKVVAFSYCLLYRYIGSG